ncbi:MAG: hypothetical protein WC602_01645 [archaeon]
MASLKRLWLRALVKKRRFLGKAKPSGLPKFKAGISTADYHFSEHKNFRFFDGHTEYFPGITLENSKGEPVFVLGYRDSNPFKICYIQRIKERPLRKPLNLEKEVRESARRSEELRKKLGVHPSEFLLQEFIWRNRKDILFGKKLFFLLDRNMRGEVITYRPILDRFFVRSKEKISDELEVYELSPKKRRVREALGPEK